jgi:hypothetical protein
MEEERIGRQKAKSKGFAALGVPVGSTLTFRKDPAITCKTADDKNMVEYRGKFYLISGLAKELMKTSISGYHAFKYNGVLLAKLGTSQTAPAPAQPPVPEKNTAEPGEEQPPVSPVSQTLPLPKPSERPPASAGTDESKKPDDPEGIDDRFDPLGTLSPEP